MQEANFQDSPEASDIDELCPYSGFCKREDDCLPDPNYWMNCWAYRSLEGLIDYQALQNVFRKRRFNRPGDIE